MNSQTFARMLKEERYKLHLGQDEFARELGIKRWRLATFEIGNVTDVPDYRKVIERYPALAMKPPPPKPLDTRKITPVGKHYVKSAPHGAVTGDINEELLTEIRKLRKSIDLLAERWK